MAKTFRACARAIPQSSFSILRRITLNLIRQDQTVKAGDKALRLKAGWDDSYRQK